VASDDVVYGDIYGFVNKVVVISTERRQVKIMPRRQLTACLQRTRRSALPNERYRAMPSKRYMLPPIAISVLFGD